MNLFLLFVLLWLGSYRATRFVLDDTLFEGTRNEFYRWFPPDGSAFMGAKRVTNDDGKRVWSAGTNTAGRARRKIGDLFYCYWCLGFWICGSSVLVAMQFISVALPVLWWFALSTAVGLTARNLDG